MVCLWCGKKVGLMRGIVDREFCSQLHRRLASKSPDRVVKDIDVTSDYDLNEMWTVERENKRQSKSGHQAVGVFAVLGILTLVAVGLSTGGSGGGGGKPGKLPSLDPTASNGGGFGDSVRSLWRSHGNVTLTHDFTTGIADFAGIRGNAKHDWSFDLNGLRPGKIRIWQKSTSLQDYDVDFLGQIEQKSMSWAFRAPDIKNYYGTKLLLNGHSSSVGGPNAGLVRFVMLDGREQDRVQLPLPLTLERGTPYKVHLTVQGSRFQTTLNNQVISSWSDSRLPRGGVGFFSEDGEVSTVRWISLAERDSMLGRLMAQFSLLQMPSALYYTEIDIDGK